MKRTRYNKDDWFEWKRKIEGALFYSGGGITIKNLISKVRDVPENLIQSLITELINNYKEFRSSLEIFEIKGKTEKKYGFRLKSDIVRESAITKFSSKKDLTYLEIRTLAYIAYNQPIEKQDVIDFVGKGAKRKINILRKRGLLSLKSDQYEVLNESGEEIIKKVTILETTPFFANYFAIKNDPEIIKTKLDDLIYC